MLTARPFECAWSLHNALQGSRAWAVCSVGSALQAGLRSPRTRPRCRRGHALPLHILLSAFPPCSHFTWPLGNFTSHHLHVLLDFLVFPEIPGLPTCYWDDAWWRSAWKYDLHFSGNLLFSVKNKVSMMPRLGWLRMVTFPWPIVWLHTLIYSTNIWQFQIMWDCKKLTSITLTLVVWRVIKGRWSSG